MTVSKRRLISREKVGDEDFEVYHVAYDYVLSPREELTYHHYRLFRSDDLSHEIGYIKLFVNQERRVARVYRSNIDQDYKYRGLGRYLYRTAINDMLEQVGVVQSDYDVNQSADANALWHRIEAANPDAVVMGDRRYVVSDKIYRRPSNIHVKRHERRSR